MNEEEVFRSYTIPDGSDTERNMRSLVKMFRSYTIPDGSDT